jgi:hypothetical protein
MIELALALVILAMLIVMYNQFADARERKEKEAYNRGYIDGCERMRREGYVYDGEFKKID